jgi:hypothetical protein
MQIWDFNNVYHKKKNEEEIDMGYVIGESDHFTRLLPLCA